MGTILLIVLFVALLASIPTPNAKRWGYGPPGILSLLLIVLLLMIFLNYVPWFGWNWGPPAN